MKDVLTALIALMFFVPGVFGQELPKSTQHNPRDPAFLPAVTYDWGGKQPGDLVVADVNGDSKPDVVATGPSGAIAVLLGRADGTFQSAKIYDSGDVSARALIVTDVNGDGKPDLIVATGYTSIGVLLGNGDGTFAAARNFDTGGYSTEVLIVTDVNGDAKPDLIVKVAYPTRSVGILLGNGDGTFQPAQTYAVGYSDGSLIVTDVNADGKPDLIVTGDPELSDGFVAVMLGNGNGTFQPAVNYDSGAYSPLFLTVQDVNGDGKPDVLVANRNGDPICPGEGVLSVMLGNGDGTFQSAATYCSGGSIAFLISIADVNSDGKLDLVALNRCARYCHAGDDRNIGVLLGNGDGTFQSAVEYWGGFEAWRMVVADVNGDGKKDLVTSVYGAPCGIGVLFGNGDGTFQPLVLHNSGGGGSFHFALEDFNGDGQPDVIVANEGSGTLGVLLNSKEFPSTTTTLVSSLNPANPKKNVTYTATVTGQSGGTLSGTVSFQDGTSDIAKVTLAGNQADFTTLYKTTGTHQITAIYWGNAETAGSTSETLTEYIQYNSKTVLATSGSPSPVGQQVTFTAKVTSMQRVIPDGELVTLYDGSTFLASGTLSGGSASFTTSSLAPGRHIITAAYTGDVTFKPSTGKISQLVAKYPTATAVISNLNPSQFGKAVTFTATVSSTGPTPTGAVKFMDGTTRLAIVTLSGGVAKLTKSKLPAGTHPITAQYAGDDANDKSTSSVLNQVVQ